MIKNLSFNILRPAIAMIELIFAIVVMGIVMMSAPMLLSTSSNSAVVVIQQEAIAEASTQANIIIGHYWDENNITDNKIRVLITTNGDANLNPSVLAAPRRPAGTPLSSGRISLGGIQASLLLGSEGGDRDDIDDFNGDSRLLFFEENAGTIDYLERATARLTSNVSYIRDTEGSGTYQDPGNDNLLTFDLNTTAFPANQTTNIKHIQVRLTSDSNINELNKSITLHAFSCNIGNYELEER